MTRPALLAVTIAAMLTGASQGFSAEATNSADQQIKNRATLQDLQALEAIQKRREFQIQQQQYREQDRQIVQPPRLDVPIMQPGGVIRR